MTASGPISGIGGRPSIAPASPDDPELFGPEFVTAIGLVAPCVLYIHDLVERRVAWGNGAMLELLGFTAGELAGVAGQLPGKLVHPEDLPGFARHAKVLADLPDGTPARFDYRMRRKDGTWAWLESRDMVYRRDVDGRPVQIIGSAQDVTARREAEAALEAKQREADELAETTRLAIEAGNAFVFDWDLAADRVHRQPAGVVLPATPAGGEPVSALLSHVHPDDRAALQQVIDRALAEPGERYHIRYRAVGETGEVRWLYEAGRVETGADGTPQRVLGVTRDVTSLIETQEKLEESERLLRQNIQELEQLYARAPLGLGLLDRDLRFVRINQALAEMNGFPVEAHVGKRVWDLLPDLQESAEPPLRRVLDAGEIMLDVPIVGTTAAQPGVVREWREQFYPVRGPDGATIGVGIVCEEVTERLRLERELRASEAHLRNVIDQLFAFVGTLRPDGTLIHANRAPLEAAGIGYDDVIGRHFAETHWWSHDTAVQQRLRDAIDRALAGETLRYDVPIRTRGDARTTIDFQIAPLRDADGTITHLIVSGVPIEDRVQAEARLRELNATLERRVAAEVRQREVTQAALFQSQKLEALGQLTAGIAHDFNNLVAAMAGGFSLVQRWSDNPRIHEVAKQGTLAAERGAELVRHLLAFARKQVLAPQLVDACDLVTKLLPLLRQSVGGAVRLRAVCADGCPPIQIDPVQLETALINLAINARDAMPDGGTVEVAVAVAEAGDEVVIAVRDQGCGMDAETLARARDPFFTTKAQGKGTGLGLAMVCGFVEQSGGRIAIDSAPGQGTTVRLAFPIREQRAADPAAMVATGSSAEDLPGRILLVDDDDLVRTIVAHQLEDLGCAVTTADGPEAGWREATAGAGFDVVLCDVVMPGESGPSLVRRLRAGASLPPVVFMTGHAGREDLGAETVVDKPFTIEALTAAIRAALATAAQGHAAS